MRTIYILVLAALLAAAGCSAPCKITLYGKDGEEKRVFFSHGGAKHDGWGMFAFIDATTGREVQVRGEAIVIERLR